MAPWRKAAASVDLWRLTMESSPVGMAIIGTAGDILMVNQAFCEMLGYEADELTATTAQALTHPDDLERDRRLTRSMLSGEADTLRVAKRYLRANGSVLSAELTAVVVRDELGEPVNFVCQMLDLSEREAFADRVRTVEAELESGQRKEQAIFESVSVGLLMVDSHGHYIAFNRRQKDLLDIAFPTGHLGHSGQPGFVYDADQQATIPPEEFPCARAAAGEEFDGELIWVGEDPDSRRALSVSARAVTDPSGAITGAALAYHDVSDTLRALRVKEEFVLTVSHELRTPLTSALAYLELLDDLVEPDGEIQHHVVAARRNVVRLSHLVADLLFSTRAMSGSSVIDPYRIDVATVLREAVDAARLDAEGLDVTVVSEGPSTLIATGDGLRLRQVIDNLLDNAILYSPSGGRVTVTLTEDVGQFTLTVADEGEGIDSDEVGQVFDRFFRGASARERQVPGTGLGLSIVRTIVEAHGGRVSLESDGADAGTTVRVLLPR